MRPELAQLGARVRSAQERHGLVRLPGAMLRRAVIAAARRVDPDHGDRPPPARARVSDDGDPRASAYLTEGHAVVVDVPLERIRWSRLGLRVDDPGRNPFLRTVVDYCAGGPSRYEGSALEEHFDRWHPRHVAEVLGLGEPAPGSPLLQPPVAVTLPWSREAATLDPRARLELWDRYAREAGLDGRALTSAHGHKHFGPVSPELGRAEFERFAAVARSIATAGFLPDAGGYIGGQVLVSGQDWAVVVTGPGLHRVVAAAALEVDPLPMVLDRHPMLVHREDGSCWPGVRSGLFGLADALDVFDRFIRGGEPPGPADHRA